MNTQTWLITIFNACLVFVIGFLLKLAIDYIKDTLKEVKGFRSDLQRLEQKFQGEIGDTFKRAVSQVYSLETRLWSELHKVRRTMVGTSLVIRRRRKEIDKILQEQEQARNRLDQYQKFSQSAVKLLKAHNSEITEMKTTVVSLSKELKIYKNGSNE